MSLVRLPPLLPAPSHPPLALPDGARQTVIYPASEALIVLRRTTADGSLAYQTSLAFPPLPSVRASASDAPGQPLGPVAADPGGERIASSAGRRVCVWERRPVEDLTNGWGPRRSSLEEEATRDGRWVVHSTVALPPIVRDGAAEEEEEAVLGLALASDRLVVQTKGALYYYTTDLAAPAPLWTLLWDICLPAPSPRITPTQAPSQPSAFASVAKTDSGASRQDPHPIPPVISPNGLHVAFCPSTDSSWSAGPRRCSRSTLSAPGRRDEALADVRILSLHADGCLRRPSACSRRPSDRKVQPGQALKVSSSGQRVVTGLEWWKDGASSDGGSKGAQVLLTSTASIGIGKNTPGQTPAVHFYAPIIDDPTYFALIHTLSAPAGDRSLHALPQSPVKSSDKQFSSNGRKQRFATTGGGSDETPAHVAFDIVGLAQSSSKLVTSTALSHATDETSSPRRKPSSGQSPAASPSWTTALDESTLVRTLSGGVPSVLSVSALHSASAAAMSSRDTDSTTAIMRQGSIQRLHRTPNGRSVLIEGSVEMVVLSLMPATRRRKVGDWSVRARWDRQEGEALWALFARGRSVVSWDRNRREVSVRYLRPSAQPAGGQSEPLAPTERTLLPGLPKDETLTTLIGLSNIDDGISPSSLTPSHSLVLAASASGKVYSWSLVRSEGPVGEASHEPKVELLSTFELPTPVEAEEEGVDESGAIVDILPVDPMAWRSTVVDWSGTGPSGETGGVPRPLQDLLLVVRAGGQLEYWSPWEGGFARGHSWSLGGCVKTGKTLARAGTTLAGGREAGADGRSPVRIRCSSAKKTVLVSWKTDCSDAVGQPDARRQELTIWDSKSSEFYSGLEYSASYPPDSPILDLDWTSTPDKASVLAVGFRDHILLLCEQQMSYLAASDVEEAGHASYWAPLLTIPVAILTPHPICDSIWLSEGTLAIGSDATLFLHSREIRYPAAERKTGAARRKGRDLFESVALHNAPLVDWHPQLLLQCLLWNKVSLVKKIVTQLYLSIEATLNDGKDELEWTPFDSHAFFGSDTDASAADQLPITSAKGSGGKGRYNGLFDDADDAAADENDNEFGRRLIDRLLEHLGGSFPLALTDHEREHLRILVQTVLEIDDLQRSLDVNGLRYLISLRFHINWRSRPTPTPSATPSVQDAPVPAENGCAGHRHGRLSFRNVVWAYHSQSQEILLGAATEACDEHKMRWEDAKALGVFLWLRSQESLRAQMETVARNEYMQGDDRDPTTCSLYYFALGKVKLVQGLWKQAAWHPEQKVMLKFLGNDFSLERWQTAALKNAFALMSKRRFEYAAAFFLLGGSLKDAVNVCVKQLNDFQLAIALARVVEGDDGPVLKTILRTTVLPRVFAGGHRWLGTWAFWMLKRRDLAVRILITPLADLRRDVDFEVTTVADPHDDDPSLALLFSQIKSLTLQTAKGSSEVPERTEFNFVLHNARVFTRMGCHVLGLDLVRSWEFDRPERISRAPSPSLLPTAASRTAAPSPFEPSADDLFALDGGSAFSSLSRATSRPAARHVRRPSSFLRDGRRGSTMVIDMDLPLSELPTRVPSPEPISTAATSSAAAAARPESPVQSTSPVVKKTGLGSLMQAAKQDAKQGAQEFDMSAFGF